MRLVRSTTRHGLRLGVLVVVSAAAGAEANAQPPPPPAPAPAPVYPPPPGWAPPPNVDLNLYRPYLEDPDIGPDGKPRKRWYGWQTLIVMGASAPLVVAYGAGLAGFTFGGPIVHWSHGHAGKGFIALGLNLGMTAVGGIAGASSFCVVTGCAGERVGGVLAGFLVGGGIGLLSANVIDVAALSYETVGGREGEARRRRSPRVMLIPQVGLSPQRAHVGLAGAF